MFKKNSLVRAVLNESNRSPIHADMIDITHKIKAKETHWNTLLSHSDVEAFPLKTASALWFEIKSCSSISKFMLPAASMRIFRKSSNPDCHRKTTSEPRQWRSGSLIWGKILHALGIHHVCIICAICNQLMKSFLIYQKKDNYVTIVIAAYKLHSYNTWMQRRLQLAIFQAAK